MDINKNVTVLAPNGRRQTVKVTPNTTILQILEEVCKKQGFKPEEYDIKHHNKCLDTSSTLRFSGLPNNAQLELAEAIKARQESVVTVGIQLENGTRLMGNFPPHESLWNVLTQVCPEEAAADSNPVVIYMRQDVYGEKLQNTTLRMLGLTGGRAMLRLIHRSPEELRQQANISAPLPSHPVEEKPYMRVFQKLESPEEPLAVPQQSVSTPASIIPDSNRNVPHNPTTKETGAKPKILKKQDNYLTDYIKQEKNKQSTGVNSSSKRDASQLILEPMEVDSACKQHSGEKTVAEEDFIFLGGRNAMIFSQETAQAVPSEDLPDDFFDLTVNDAKKLLRDIKNQRSQLENSQLQTSAMRNLQQTTKQLQQIHRYKKSIIRVYFPDQTVLQGTFTPTETVSNVLEFVREYLENAEIDFHLYTAPPKNILSRNNQLIEAGCVPSAIVYFGTNMLNKDEKYLRSDLIGKFTTASVASLAATKMRQYATRPPIASDSNENDILHEDAVLAAYTTVNPGPSTSDDPMYEDYGPRTSKPAEKLPKWFKPSK